MITFLACVGVIWLSLNAALLIVCFSAVAYRAGRRILRKPRETHVQLRLD